MRTHRYAVGQHVSYSETCLPDDVWKGHYEVVFLLPAGDREPQYQIRSDDQTYDRVVGESQLQEEFGRRTMRLNHHALRTTTALASPERRARQNRNDPRKPSQHQDLTRWDDEGGAPRSGHQAEVEEIEDCILDETSTQLHVRRLYQLRRDLLRLRNAAVPLVEVCRRLEQPGLPGIDPSMSPLFRDVSDHIRRVQEEIESLREVLAFAFETSLMPGQSQQTEITRKLAAWAAILAVPTAVAGIYGMNFDVLPELHWKYGYPFVLTLIALVCGWLYWRFRKKQWL